MQVVWSGNIAATILLTLVSSAEITMFLKHAVRRSLILFAIAQSLSAASSAHDYAAWAVGAGLIFIALICLIYPLPAIIAFHRRHRNRWLILVINIAFGATMIGWLIALVW